MHGLTYDATFAGKNTCFLLDDGFTLRCRVAVASAGEIVCDVALRHRKPRDGGVHVRAMNSELDVWQCESGVHHPDLPRLELQLDRVPPHVAAALREL